MMSTPIIISVNPKYVGGSASSDEDVDNIVVPGKKRRLDHLTWDEKIQRKKLKNRVAAQTSRDRKKAKMDELITEVNLLKAECDKLREQNIRLSSENKSLRKHLEKQDLTRSVDYDSLTGPAVSYPLQQEGVTSSASQENLLNSQTPAAWIMLMSLISQIYSKSSTPRNALNISPTLYYRAPCFKKILRMSSRVNALIRPDTVKWCPERGMNQNSWNIVSEVTAN